MHVLFPEAGVMDFHQIRKASVPLKGMTSKMEGIKFSENIVIGCSPEFAFDYTQDYANRLKWDRFLKQADLIEGATKAGKGVKAYCVARNGFGMITEYVSFNRPKTTAIKMTKDPFLFKAFLGSWTFKVLESNLTEVVFLYSFKLRFPFNLVAGLLKRNLQSNVRQRLIDLKTSIETTRATRQLGMGISET